MGKPLIEDLIEFAKGDVDRVYCLVRAFIVCAGSLTGWKNAIVDGVSATHIEEFSEAIADKNAWSSLDAEGRYTTTVDFLWSYHILRAKDFVGISADGTFQLRQQLMEGLSRWTRCRSLARGRERTSRPQHAGYMQGHKRDMVPRGSFRGCSHDRPCRMLQAPP